MREIAQQAAHPHTREHARVLSRHPDVELCAIVGRSPEKAARRAAEFATTPYTDLDEMLDAEKPELVSLCLPNESHFDTTLRVIEAGYPLLVEKPLVFDLALKRRVHSPGGRIGFGPTVFLWKDALLAAR